MDKTSYIFYFMCDSPISFNLLNIKYHSIENIENMWISVPITHQPKLASTPYNRWLIAF